MSGKRFRVWGEGPWFWGSAILTGLVLTALFAGPCERLESERIDAAVDRALSERGL